ncbi:hypothetical protein D3C76_841970 [compost metagenome]
MGDRPVLWAALSRRALNSQAARVPCGSGFSREESNTVPGTGCAGVRGHARSHKVPANSMSYVLFYEKRACRTAAKRPKRCMGPAPTVVALLKREAAAIGERINPFNPVLRRYLHVFG